ncbi:MAG TPA: OmpA family protein [Pseudomonadales bacterium]|nr:OmpA family protein [Pseudomonadales bacterium]
MNRFNGDLKKIGYKKPLAMAIASLLVVACSTAGKPDGSVEVRNKLTQLQANPDLASRAPVAIKDAEVAVRAAEETGVGSEESRHRVFMADHKVDIAEAQAKTRLLEDQRTILSQQRESSRLDSRTREADKAHGDAAAARTEAELAHLDTADARRDAASAQQQNEELQRQIAELNAKETERGLVVTLGDVLFDTDKSDLKGGATSNLGKLAAFLNKYPGRTVMIEGHTDSTGAEDYNQSLSQRRADSVKSYLVHQGVEASRFTTAGLGEGSPVASNDTQAGRQQNRRVEVIISK